MKSGYWKVSIKEEEWFKTTFSDPFGHYEWNFMPFTLKHDPSNFKKVMDQVFKPHFYWIIIYIDDVLIFSRSRDEHFKHVQKFKQIFKRNGLFLSKNMEIL